MKLTVVLPGIYNDEDGKADNYDAGELLETNEPYGKSLVEDGYCTQVVTVKPTKQTTLAHFAPTPKVAIKQEEEEEVDTEAISAVGTLSPLLEVGGIKMEMLEKMVNMGITEPEDLAGTPDEDLMKLGLTKATIKAMRKKLGIPAPKE